jgi:hypothetical protein
MDEKTLEWMNQRTHKGIVIRQKIKTLRDRRASIVDSNTVRLEFSLEIRGESRKDKAVLHTGTETLEVLQKYYSVIYPSVIEHIDKEIAELEAEFAEL